MFIERSTFDRHLRRKGHIEAPFIVNSVLSCHGTLIVSEEVSDIGELNLRMLNVVMGIGLFIYLL